ncbi:Putative FAD dependent oxidoreductase, FAD/NAD(P)-binding domain superfamily [Septoria linicola]|uniref:FAD dependent oxidoreductase, FAD/NAD(P)-binding domain superfamily n=1 Tax=Septoria linicola TaxID=215465 RepID=A0A9Q9END3_9PEZI|nr:putative FAD dependent oxidoreductase, FAD/NAD(P)-binding domain superfamily [Septoria linicola]USW55368.1 Putative FAD dependent oxidoreductase, FAD/NAD(P)-binding domain superfamily [Septoria linicola]
MAGSTVILGAGIIGTATAYYLSQDPSAGQVHLVEASPELFASASGKAGGFLAEDWFGPATAELGELSFRLHRELAEQYDGRKKWGYSRSTGTSLVVGRDKSSKKKSKEWLQHGGSRAEVAKAEKIEHYTDGSGPGWMRKKDGNRVEMISDEGGVAQVDPKRLCEFLLEKSLEQGVKLHQPARATKILQDREGVVAGVTIQKPDETAEDISCSRILIAAGAWTSRVFAELFPTSSTRIPVTQLAGHSLVVRSPRWTAEQEATGCHAVFASSSEAWSPEIFSRIGEEIYIAGLNSSSMPLPDLPTGATADRGAIEQVTQVTEQMIGSDFEVVRDGLCFRPVTRSGNPILAQVPDAKLDGGVSTAASGGVFVCAGHGPWGISLGLGTGKVMSEMLQHDEMSCDVNMLGSG